MVEEKNVLVTNNFHFFKLSFSRFKVSISASHARQRRIKPSICWSWYRSRVSLSNKTAVSIAAILPVRSALTMYRLVTGWPIAPDSSLMRNSIPHLGQDLYSTLSVFFKYLTVVQKKKARVYVRACECKKNERKRRKIFFLLQVHRTLLVYEFRAANHVTHRICCYRL